LKNRYTIETIPKNRRKITMVTQNPSQDSHKAAMFILGTAAIIVVGIAAVLWIRTNVLPCTVGVTGYAANITFQGSGAHDDFDKFVQQYPQHYYILTGEPTGAVICEGNLVAGKTYSGAGAGMPTGLEAGPHFIVRDIGTFNLVGGQICRDLIPATGE
jgi:hypothetical protein